MKILLSPTQTPQMTEHRNPATQKRYQPDDSGGHHQHTGRFQPVDATDQRAD